MIMLRKKKETLCTTQYNEIAQVAAQQWNRESKRVDMRNGKRIINVKLNDGGK